MFSTHRSSSRQTLFLSRTSSLMGYSSRIIKPVMMKATGAAPISNFNVYTTGGGCLQAPVSYPANLRARTRRQSYDKKRQRSHLKTDCRKLMLLMVQSGRCANSSAFLALNYSQVKG